ncbi:MAG TPA: hypothetical protein VNY27_01585 [Solirubrobacteraceae bacterium]|nr:hypothetical protein [Solirubrobacteraceae bacterium]
MAGELGPPATRAGSHPYALTTTIVFNHETKEENEQFELDESLGEEVPIEIPEVLGKIYGEPKHIVTNLPAGLVVNPTVSTRKCTERQLETVPAHGGGCPVGSVVGVATIYAMGANLGFFRSPVYNMVPPAGVPAEFGLNPGEIGFIAHIIGGVRTGGDYGLSGSVSEITQLKRLWAVKLTLWGNPSDPSHDRERGVCGVHSRAQQKIKEETYTKLLETAIMTHKRVSEYPEESFYEFNCPLPARERTGTPFLTMPGSCTGSPLATSMSTYSWQKPEELIAPPPFQSPAITGCNELAFHPSLSTEPSPKGVGTESPSGLNVDLKVPQEESLAGRAEANLKEAVVKFPMGMAVSPSAANGLGACPLEGPEGINLTSAEPAKCPDSSKVANVEIDTQLLEHPLKGSVFLAQQGDVAGNGSNPFGSLLALYVVAEGQGAVVKLPGEIVLDKETGQLTARFGKDPVRSAATGEAQFLPQLPFSDVRMSFFGGSRAPLITPIACGTYTTASQLFPWSGGPPKESQSSFTISQGCGAGVGFSPSFTAGTINNQAGAFSPLSVTLARQDREQRLSGVQVTTPPGLLGVLKSVVQCPDPQAAHGTCGPESQIGVTTVSVGPGGTPYWVKDGKVYLTGPYNGAPFGLSIVVPTTAGPFTLTGNGGFGKEVVRAKVEVDSHTAQVRVTSDPLPTILQGIPLDVRTINVTVNRPDFMFNPTNCSQLSVTALITSTAGASTGVSSPFEASNCANLPFKPKFAATTAAKTSKANGASLVVKVTPGPGQANIAKARVTLPKQLPARLTTLQKACTDKQFNANPAGCPLASNVGTAMALTPLLAHPLTGPAYLVSHGGAAFPDLVFVLQGEGITLYLDGNTNIKKGITTSTFNSAPDAPVSSFETTFPEGPFSVLATNLPTKAKGNMCRQKLTMPTTLTGQNGAVVTQTTKIAVTGCPKKAKKAAGKRGKR